MNIIFKDIHCKNFLSLGDVHYTLNDRGFVLVYGENKNQLDNASSNGSGKSSLFEAIFYCITGETIRGTRDVVRHGATDGTTVELDFVVDKNTYKIIRYKDDATMGTNLKFYVNGEDASGKGIRDTEKILADYLPELNVQLLGSVIVLGQGLPQRFTNNTPSGRKEVLEKLSKSDFMIEDIKEKLTNRKAELTKFVEEQERSITALKSKIEVNTRLIDDRQRAIGENTFTENQFCDRINEKKDKQKQANEKLKELQDGLSNLDFDTKIEELEKQIEESRAKYSEIDKSYSLVAYQITEQEKAIKDAQDVKTECPMCHRAFDHVHKIDTSEMEQKLQLKREELNNIKVKRDEIISFGTGLANQLTQIKSDKNLKVQAISSIEKTINDLELEITNINREHEQSLTKLNVWKEDIEKATKEIEQYNEEIKEITQKHTQLCIRLDCVNKLSSYASRDFRGYLLDGVVNYINNKVQQYSTVLFNTTNVQFKTDGNQIWIGFQDKAYENLSGGEKQKVDILVQFAIREMLMNLMNFSCNILVLDEIFDNLDEQGCENIINLITSKLIDIQSVFIITHHADISVPYDDKMIVLKDERGVSNIVGE